MGLNPNSVTGFIQVINKYIEQFQAKNGYHSIGSLGNNRLTGTFQPRYCVRAAPPRGNRKRLLNVLLKSTYVHNIPHPVSLGLTFSKKVMRIFEGAYSE